MFEKTEEMWIDSDIIQGIIQNTRGDKCKVGEARTSPLLERGEYYKWGEEPRTSLLDGDLAIFYEWRRVEGNSSGGVPSEYRLFLTQLGKKRQAKAIVDKQKKQSNKKQPMWGAKAGVNMEQHRKFLEKQAYDKMKTEKKKRDDDIKRQYHENKEKRRRARDMLRL